MKFQINKILLLIPIVLSALSFNVVNADAINEIMLIDNSGNIIYINPENLEKHTINTIEDLRKLLTKTENSQNSEDGIKDSDPVKENIIDVAPFADEVQYSKPQTNQPTQQSSNTTLLDAKELDLLINSERIQNNISTLSTNTILTKVAENRCVDMSITNNTSDRSTSSIISSIKSNNENVTLATELLYWSSISSQGEDAVDWWMNEPKYHRSNVLKTSFTNVGSSICKNNTTGKSYFVSVFSN